MRIFLTLIFGFLGVWTIFCVIKFIGAILLYLCGNLFMLTGFGVLGFIIWRRMIVRKRRRRVLRWANQDQINHHPQKRAHDTSRRYTNRRSNSA